MLTELNISQLAVIIFALHVFADFNLQIGAKLDQFKQERWWKHILHSVKMPADKRNKYHRRFLGDYRAGLLVHAGVWAAVTFLPLVLLAESQVAVWMVLVPNALVHTLVDHLKANKRAINLRTDQFLHILQIAITLVLWHVYGA